MYLGVVRLKDGEYAVKMKTMPAAKRMDRLLKQNKVTPKMIKRLAQVIWTFHRTAKIVKGKFGKAKTLRQAFEHDFKIATKFKGPTIRPILYRRIHTYLSSFLLLHAKWFARRIKAGKVRDLHGDLYSENIFYLKKPYLFDCIEFNPYFRYVDCAAEVGFFLMDLECRGETKLAKIFLQAYLEQSRDWESLKLLNFYKCHYAFVRGTVNCLARHFKHAKKFFNLAGKYAQEKPALLAVGGIIGTGKSTLAKGLAKSWGARLLQSDKIRKKLAGVPTLKHYKYGFKKGMYLPAFTQKTYRALLSQAENSLKKGQNVVLDASFSKKSLRKKLISLARRTGANFNFFETVAPNKIILRRLKRRKNDISDAGSWLLDHFKKSYEPPTEMPVIQIMPAPQKRP
jgi:predicted kinase